MDDSDAGTPGGALVAMLLYFSVISLTAVGGGVIMLAPDIHRYVRAMTHRLDRLPSNLPTDTDHMATVTRVTDVWHQALSHSPTGRIDPVLAEVRWMIEELKVSLFAQFLGTPYPVSEKRVLRAIERAGSQ